MDIYMDMAAQREVLFDILRHATSLLIPPYYTSSALPSPIFGFLVQLLGYIHKYTNEYRLR